VQTIFVFVYFIPWPKNLIFPDLAPTSAHLSSASPLSGWCSCVFYRQCQIFISHNLAATNWQLKQRVALHEIVKGQIYYLCSTLLCYLPCQCNVTFLISLSLSYLPPGQCTPPSSYPWGEGQVKLLLKRQIMRVLCKFLCQSAFVTIKQMLKIMRSFTESTRGTKKSLPHGGMPRLWVWVWV